MKKLTIIILSTLVALSVLCYFQTTRAMLMQAVQAAASVRYARVHMAPTIVKMPFSSYKFTVALPTLRWQRPHNQERAHYFQPDSDQPVYDDRPKKSPFPLLATAVLTLTNTVAPASDDKKQEPAKKPVQTTTSKKIVQEAEDVAQAIAQKMGIEADKNTLYRIADLSFEEQDKFLAALMERLIDPSDTCSYKAVACAAGELEKLWARHPELSKLIKAHAEKPQPKSFLDELNALDFKQMPPVFGQVKQEIHSNISAMGYWEYINFCCKIYMKF